MARARMDSFGWNGPNQSILQDDVDLLMKWSVAFERAILMVLDRCLPSHTGVKRPQAIQESLDFHALSSDEGVGGREMKESAQAGNVFRPVLQLAFRMALWL